MSLTHDERKSVLKLITWKNGVKWICVWYIDMYITDIKDIWNTHMYLIKKHEVI